MPRKKAEPKDNLISGMKREIVIIEETINALQDLFGSNPVTPQVVIATRDEILSRLKAAVALTKNLAHYHEVMNDGTRFMLRDGDGKVRRAAPDEVMKMIFKHGLDDVTRENTR